MVGDTVDGECASKYGRWTSRRISTVVVDTTDPPSVRPPILIDLSGIACIGVRPGFSRREWFFSMTVPLVMGAT